jgi:hypothetical protein
LLDRFIDNEPGTSREPVQYRLTTFRQPDFEEVKSMGAYLKNFPDSELIFDEQETRQILIFFFPYDKDKIYSATINNDIRNFAQGILVEAVDASYSMGYVKVLFKSIVSFLMSANPAKGPTDFLKTLGRKAMSHWFEHATHADLMHAKIYDSVRWQLNQNFQQTLYNKLLGLAKVKGRSIYVGLKPQNYAKSSHEILWG